MCRIATGCCRLAMAWVVVWPAWSQTVTAPVLDWRHVGSYTIERGLPSPGTGPVTRVWFGADGLLRAQTRSGVVWQTADFETWSGSTATPPAPASQTLPGARQPEADARLAAAPSQTSWVYALGSQVYRSEDGGRSWHNLTQTGQECLLGEDLTDLTVSPANPQDLVVAGRHGVWRSLDGGMTWAGLNQTLPNLPVRKLLALPGGGAGVKLQLEGLTAEDTEEVEWSPGERQSWQLSAGLSGDSAAGRRRQMAKLINPLGDVPLTLSAEAGTYFYAGTREGRLWASPDGGRTWQTFAVPEGGPVESLYVDPAQPALALAALGARPGEGRHPHVLRTTNGGLFWDDLTANLPEQALHGIAADRASGTIYVAGDGGVYMTTVDLAGAGPPGSWTALQAGLPNAPLRDVRLDLTGNQLYVAAQGYGVFAVMAPHRRQQARVVSAADWQSRPAAPGSLLTVLGLPVQSARAGDQTMPVLAASDAESQIQVPFDVTGDSVALALDGPKGRLTMAYPLRAVSPAVMVTADGAPLLLDGDSGVMLDAAHAARSGSRLQILTTGLGRVQPDWPAGMAAPLQDTPRVLASVKVFLDRVPVEVTRATLAPGYIGLYLLEVTVPKIVNLGPAELYLEADGQTSNRVRVYLEP